MGVLEYRFPLSPRCLGYEEGYARGIVACVGESIEEMEKSAKAFYAGWPIDPHLAERPDFLEGVVEGAMADRHVQNLLTFSSEALIASRRVTKVEGLFYE